MPQSKISAFFKPSHPKTRDTSRSTSPIPPSEISVTYKRRNPESDPKSDDEGLKKNKKLANAGKTLNKNKSYAQYHLELGQSDFLLHSCSVCGLMYAQGDEGDGKVHRTFHKNYYEGIQFKGWGNERVVATFSDNGDRVVLVVDSNSSTQKNKVKQVIEMMEKELGFNEGQLLHKLCKVYLFISNHRIVGCLVAEPIRTAHKVISSSSSRDSNDGTSTKLLTTDLPANGMELRKANATLQFGQFNFKREIIRRGNLSDKAKVEQWETGAILCEEEAMPALCGFRAIWVVPSNRRKGIASKLIDAARKSFCTAKMLEVSECAFSSPTSAGKALACRYSKTSSFMVYKEEDL
ncbi:protein CHROMOSOME TRANSMISSION FIDELITY 7-like isoform X1 [Typha angustifolia]|uniref:protein CHROMOSOME TRANSMISSION FIDELITY 7-like isoform X1 n=2 Tax=Typha angustifolia TaxID=59011 RepID=UPI003C2C487D